MHRIDGPGATAENKFTEGNPSTGVPATQVTGDFMNAVQEELAAIIEGAGGVLDKLDNTQLLAALKGARLHATSGYQKLLSGLIIQWGFATIATTTGGTLVTFPIAFPTACFCVVLTDNTVTAQVPSGVAKVGLVSDTKTATNFKAACTDNAGTYTQSDVTWIAIGN